jgi:hypothetical protein
MSITSFKELGHRIERVTGTEGFAFSAVGDVLASLTKSDVTALLDSMLEEVKTSGRLPSVEENNVYLYRRPEFNLLVRFSDSGTRLTQLSANEFDAFVLNLSNRQLEIPVYRCRIDAADPGRRPGPLAVGDTLRLAPRGLHGEAAFGNILDLDAASEARAWTTWTFDRETLQPLQRVSTDIRASRVDLALRYLAESNSPVPETVLQEIVESDYAGHVRWQAAKYLCRLNPETGLQALQVLSGDATDPGIQKAAQATLKNFQHGGRASD